jgi:hypothetical protein
MIHIAQKSFVNVATESIHFVQITELLRAVANNLPGFKAAIKEQIDQTLFLPVRELLAQEFP